MIWCRPSWRLASPFFSANPLKTSCSSQQVLAALHHIIGPARPAWGGGGHCLDSSITAIVCLGEMAPATLEAQQQESPARASAPTCSTSNIGPGVAGSTALPAGAAARLRLLARAQHQRPSREGAECSKVPPITTSPPSCSWKAAEQHDKEPLTEAHDERAAAIRVSTLRCGQPKELWNGTYLPASPSPPPPLPLPLPPPLPPSPSLPLPPPSPRPSLPPSRSQPQVPKPLPLYRGKHLPTRVSVHDSSGLMRLAGKVRWLPCMWPAPYYRTTPRRTQKMHTHPESPVSR